MKKATYFVLRPFIFYFVCIFSLTGCAIKQVKLTKSGFLKNYSEIKEDKNSKGMYIYRNLKSEDIDQYSKILIAPVEFKLNPTVAQHKMKYADREKLSNYFEEQLTKRLEDNYEITDEPGVDVLLFRSAITDILPNKVYLNLHWSTTLIGAGIGGASLEAELVDSVTGERMLAFIDARKGRKLNYTKGLTKWGHSQEVLAIWADIMVENLDELRESK